MIAKLDMSNQVNMKKTFSYFPLEHARAGVCWKPETTVNHLSEQL